MKATASHGESIHKSGEKDNKAPQTWTQFEILFLSDLRLEMINSRGRSTLNYAEFGLSDRRTTKQRVRESAKTTSKTVAKEAEQNRRRELERGFNGVEDVREDRIRPIRTIAAEYLEQYNLRNRSQMYAKYAVGHVTRHLGKVMAVDVTDKTVVSYQTSRLTAKRDALEGIVSKGKASPIPPPAAETRSAKVIPITFRKDAKSASVA